MPVEVKETTIGEVEILAHCTVSECLEWSDHIPAGLVRLWVTQHIDKTGHPVRLRTTTRTLLSPVVTS